MSEPWQKVEWHFTTKSGTHYVWSPMCQTLRRGDEVIMSDVMFDGPRVGHRAFLTGRHWPENKEGRLSTSEVVEVWDQTDREHLRLGAMGIKHPERYLGRSA